MKLKESLVSRRQFINGCLAGTGTFVGGTVAYTLASSLIPKVKDDNTPLEIKLSAGDANLTPNSAKPFFLGLTPALLIMSEHGELIALKAVCTHFECLIQYDPVLKKVVCPCHRGFFDIYGNNLEGPPPRPLIRYKIHQDTEGVVIRRENAV